MMIVFKISEDHVCLPELPDMPGPGEGFGLRGQGRFAGRPPHLNAHMIPPPTFLHDNLLIKRLKRLEGQIRGIEKMIAEDRDCVSIVGVGALVLNNCMKLCFY
jgi:hypothetical protein